MRGFLRSDWMIHAVGGRDRRWLLFVLRLVLRDWRVGVRDPRHPTHRTRVWLSAGAALREPCKQTAINLLCHVPRIVGAEENTRIPREKGVVERRREINMISDYSMKSSCIDWWYVHNR